MVETKYSGLWKSRKTRLLVGIAAGLVVLWLGSSLWQALLVRRDNARYEAEQRRISTEMNRVRVWPEYRVPSLGGAVASLRTVCASETVGFTGRFRYQLRVQPASTVLAHLEPQTPQPSRVRGDESDLSSTGPQAQGEWNEFQRRRDEETRRLQRQLGIPTHPILTVEFLDENGFRVHEILIPRDSLVEDNGTSGGSLVAERQQQATCGSEVLRFHSWRLRRL